MAQMCCGTHPGFAPTTPAQEPLIAPEGSHRNCRSIQSNIHSEARLCPSCGSGRCQVGMNGLSRSTAQRRSTLSFRTEGRLNRNGDCRWQRSEVCLQIATNLQPGVGGWGAGLEIRKPANFQAQPHPCNCQLANRKLQSAIMICDPSFRARWA